MSHPSLLPRMPGWSQGMGALMALDVEHGGTARERASNFSQVYQGRRAAMVFDVVASRQRKYDSRVRTMVATFEQSRSAHNLHSLANNGPGEGHGLRSGEGETMQAAAAGLLHYCQQAGMEVEPGLRQWANESDEFEHASKLEPFVGHVRGMGPALLAYLRMRCGGDALKPDVRVSQAFRNLGFSVPNDPHAVLVVARGVSKESNIPLLVLDQLLWFSGDRSRMPAD